MTDVKYTLCIEQIFIPTEHIQEKILVQEASKRFVWTFIFLTSNIDTRRPHLQSGGSLSASRRS